MGRCTKPFSKAKRTTKASYRPARIPDSGAARSRSAWRREIRKRPRAAITGSSRAGAPVRTTIRFSRNGPIVDEVLPLPARQTGPVALQWLGAYQGGWLTALLAMDRASSAEALREATRPWQVPTFSVVFADVDGHI